MESRSWYIEGFQVILGCFIAALGLTMFLIPNKLAAGGVSGLATVLHYVFNLPVGIVMLALNIPLFLAGFVILGKGIGIKTLIGTLFFSILTEVLADLPVPTNDLLLSSVYGGLILGIGLGIVFRARSTTGGSDLASMLLNHYIPAVSIGQGILLIDFFVVIFDGVIFNWELAMYSWIALFISSKVIDLVQEGFNYAKAVYIISNDTESISRKIMKEMGRGVTFLGGKGGYTGIDKNVLLCVITRMELSKLKSIVNQQDPRAFVIVHDVHEVLGEGFSLPNNTKKQSEE